jgi:hypothetical protein
MDKNSPPRYDLQLSGSKINEMREIDHCANLGIAVLPGQSKYMTKEQ